MKKRILIASAFVLVLAAAAVLAVAMGWFAGPLTPEEAELNVPQYPEGTDPAIVEANEKKREESRMKSKRISPYKKVETNLIEQETINKFFFDSIENDATPLEDLPIKGFQFLTEMFERKNAPNHWL